MTPAALVGLVLSLLGLLQLAAADCGGSRSIALCCMGLGPYYSNENVWGSVCGYYPSDDNILIGGRCISMPSTGCPTGSIGTCCAGTWPGYCALGTDCGGSPSSTPTSGTSTTTTSTTSTPPATPSPLPSGWILASACAQDSSSRVLVNDVSTILDDNTPSACAAHCSAANYYYAGVEYGDECHCGTGIVSGADTPLDPSQCAMACAGDAEETCGGSWAIQLYQYQGQAPTETLPKGWVPVTPCAVDTAARDINGDQVTTLSNNTPATCIEFCAAGGFDYAGVEYGNECHCGTGTTIRQIAPAADCSMPCAGNPALTCGGSWRIQIYSSEPQD